MSALLVGSVVALPSPAFGVADTLDVHRDLEDFDGRGGRLAPSGEQAAIVESLGASATWNRFGTPASLIDYDGYLGDAAGRPVAAARAWLSEHRDLFRLSSEDVADLQLVNDAKMARGSGHAVLFQQRFGDLVSAAGGTIVVGVANEKDRVRRFERCR